MAVSHIWVYDESAPGARSASRWVPSGVPSVTQGSTPLSPSSAQKKTWRPAVTGRRGQELPAPGTISASRTVPSGVPSLHQGSRPWTPSSAKKSAEAVAGTPAKAGSSNLVANTMAGTMIGRKSVSWKVPPGVPSVRQSSP